jgi:hypothetical protein
MGYAGAFMALARGARSQNPGRSWPVKEAEGVVAGIAALAPADSPDTLDLESRPHMLGQFAVR